MEKSKLLKNGRNSLSAVICHFAIVTAKKAQLRVPQLLQLGQETNS
jgi:hypothetical protein